ncbi:MAG: DUF2884 family protein [Lysobacterales bacterium]|uniref:YggN family protein n=1 Tax=Thermomonas beijingensis TaxID=2872701 RepID=A0ABS7TG44_9GAMM|nr:DUF2884 family protein [Thermomonas beijingensis]MBZ4186845.1 YggN family protein [Thermomonas beijingensis]
MNIRIATAVIACMPLLGCSQPPAPPAPPTPPAPPATADKGFIGQQVDKALTQARKELREGNLSLNGDMKINVNGHNVSRHTSGLPKGEISPQGDLLIDGKPVAITPAQRQQLLAYRGQIINIAEAGMAIGSQGADIAGTALQGVAGAIFGGEKGQKDFEARMEAEGKKIEAQAMKLCAYLPPMLASQQALAGSLPAFKPYATMTQDDINDCGKKGDKGVAVISDDSNSEDEKQ